MRLYIFLQRYYLFFLIRLRECNIYVTFVKLHLYSGLQLKNFTPYDYFEESVLPHLKDINVNIGGYVAQQLEIIELEIEGAILSGSQLPNFPDGGGI